MAEASGSKNDPTARRGRVKKEKTYKGQKVVPIKFVGNTAGKSTYIAAAFENGQIVEDENTGDPIAWSNV